MILLAINWSTVGIVALICLGLSILFTALILIISKICAVQEDENIGKVANLLAGANCGGCGKAGCKDFACALINGEAKLNDCGSTSTENKAEIAKILNIPFTKEEKTYAAVMCSGGDKAFNKYRYVGNRGCANQTRMQNGSKLCKTACLGQGDCVKECPASAISVENGVAVINKALCISCRTCVITCPKGCITLLSEKAKVFVACHSDCKGRDVTNECQSGCIGCGICARFCPANAIVMENNLPSIDNDKCTGCLTCVAKCPRHVMKEIK